MYQKPFTLTQGGADTAAETTIATGLLPGVDMSAWVLKAIQFTVSPNLVKAWAAADIDFTIQLTKRSLAGSIVRLVTFTDQDLLYSWNAAAILSGTAANLAVMETSRSIDFPVDTLVYAENLYMQIISASTGQTNIAWGRLLYDLKKLSNAEALTLVASRP
jgi:hypothetical protein